MLLLALSASAVHAQVREFDKLSIDVPEGWNAQQVDTTVVIVKDDKTAALTISIEPLNGHTLSEIARDYSASFKGTQPKSNQAGVYTFTFNDGNTQAVVYSAITSYILTTITGTPEGQKTIAEMVSTMKLKGIL